MLALSAALAAACFVRAFGVTFLGRPRTTPRGAGAGDRSRLARRHVRARGALPAGRHLAGLRHRCAGAGGAELVGGAHAGAERAAAGCRSCRSPRAAAPTTACWSSSSSQSSTLLAVEVIHRFASRAVRRGPAWDCGYPDAEPGHAVHRRQLRPADPPRLRRRSCSRPASGSTCRRPATRGRRASPSRCAISSGTAIYAPHRGAASASPPSSSTTCSS